MQRAKGELIEKIRQIAKEEKFKIDAFYFCGFPGGTPNEKLKKACDAYLELFDAGKEERAVTEALLAELEAAAQKESNVESLMDNRADMREILERKAELLA